MANNIDVITKFLKAKGLSDNAIAGVLGNLQIESGFRPDAYNAGENAIGVVQWEGGRRTNLDVYAQRTSGSETSLSTQLGYMWSELQNSYPQVLSALQQKGISPTQAAQVWESQYEGSAPGSWPQRQSAAEFFASHGLTGSAPSSPSGVIPASGPSGATGSGSGGGTATATNAGFFGDVTSAVIPKSIQTDLGNLFGKVANATGIPGAINAVAAPLQLMGELFNKLLWIFTPSHFFKVQLYLLGAILFGTGFWLIIKGAE